eukprot:gene39205-10734_t
MTPVCPLPSEERMRKVLCVPWLVLIPTLNVFFFTQWLRREGEDNTPFDFPPNQSLLWIILYYGTLIY